MSDAAWTAMAVIATGLFGLMSAVLVGIIKVVGELFGTKKQQTVREMIKGYHESNTERIAAIETNQVAMKVTVENGFNEVRMEIDEVRRVSGLLEEDKPQYPLTSNRPDYPTHPRHLKPREA